VKVNLMLLNVGERELDVRDAGESELDAIGCLKMNWMLVKVNLMLLDVGERELDVTGCW